MPSLASRPIRRMPSAVALIAACALVPVAQASAAPAPRVHPVVASAGCAAGHSDPAQVSERQLQGAVLCLLNQQRTRRGLRRLRLDQRLSLASLRHARDMVQRRYFAHESRNGRAFSQRILATGYGSRGFRLLGENIAWGAGLSASPYAIVDMWMHSAGHRANILRPGFRDIGIGIYRGTPGHGAGATYATDFGTRR
jgi:uncharacterized protein YkwD